MKRLSAGLLLGLLAADARLTAAPVESIEVLRALRGSEGAPRGTPVVAPDGTVYGVTQYGGNFYGSIYALHPDGSGGYTYEELYAFQTETGFQPQAGLVIASDGLLYGTTTAVGAVGTGTVFRFDPASRVMTVLHQFSGTDGSSPEGALVEGEPLVFYGTTRFGGDSNFGTVFRVDGSGTFERLHSFSGSDGKLPYGRVYRAANGEILGTASSGAGVNNYGCVFKIDAQGVFSVLHAFDGGSTDGSGPHGGLSLGPGGYVYGTTWDGGSIAGGGTIFRIALGNVEIVHSFIASEGWTPMGDLADDGAGGLVGATTGGGSSGLGTVYRFTPPGTLDVLHSFAGSPQDGASTDSGPAVDPSGRLVGATWFGGLHGVGVAYQIDSGQESLVHTFEIEAAYPLGPLVTGLDAKLYGVAGRVVPSIFRWDPVAGTFASLVSVRDPDLELVEASWSGLAETPDGWFYGTSAGDQFELGGSVWRAKLDGTVETLHSFLGGQEHLPMAGLTLSGDGSLYGTTTFSSGNLFRIDPPDGTYTPLTTLESVNGPPCGRLLSTAPGVLYGNAANGIFRFDAPSTVTLVHDFGTDGSGAAQPCSDLTIGSDGAYYVTTRVSTDLDGNMQQGGAYRVSSAGTDTLCVFHLYDGAQPYAGLTEASPGVFYGTTTGGGSGNLPGYGTLFRTDSSGRCDVLYSFDGASIGGNPFATLLRAPDGYLYGTTSAGGWWAGTLIRLSAGMPLVTVAPTSGPADGGTAITMTGTNFEPGAAVSVGDVALPDAQIGGPTSATATTPALPPGTLHHVLVLNADRSAGMVIEGWLADFLDVPQADPFHSYIEEIVRRHIAAGFGDGSYGRNASVTRAQMAVLLLKAKHGTNFVPPHCTGTFTDVPCPSMFADWVERLAAEGIAAGCGNGNYCPNDAVRRDQMAVFLLKAEHGSGYVPPVCTGQFRDVTCPSLFADWIERLAAENVTAGCGGGDYCPLAPNTRGQMGVFLTRVFFPLP